MRPIFRTLAAAVKKVWAGGELGTRLPNMETVEIWAAGGLAVQDCWNSELPWAEVAALVDSKAITKEMVMHGTELLGIMPLAYPRQNLHKLLHAF